MTAYSADWLCESAGTVGGQGSPPEPPLALGEERLHPNEAHFIEAMGRIQREFMTPKPPTLRGQHSKQHGCVVAEFQVAADVPEELRHGIFREPKTYRTIIRFSNGASFDDSKPDIHGMAIKLIGVSGKKALDGDKDPETQDFMLMDHPVFFAENIESLVQLITASLEARKNKNPALLAPFGAAHPEAFKAFQESRGLINPDNKRPASPFNIPYFSTTPYRLGAGAVKYLVRPQNEPEIEPPTKDTPDYLRQMMVSRLSSGNDVVFHFYLQRQSDPVKEPIENPTVLWTTEEQKVATIVIKPQKFDSLAQLQFGEKLTFTPWHALEEHRPLGGINRARLPIYQASSDLRHQSSEPTEDDLTEFG